MLLNLTRYFRLGLAFEVDQMSALGQKQTLGHVRIMSALPPKADIRQRDSGSVGALLFPAVKLDLVWPGRAFAGFEE